jgi:hypothetical protein
MPVTQLAETLSKAELARQFGEQPHPQEVPPKAPQDTSQARVNDGTTAADMLPQIVQARERR